VINKPPPDFSEIKAEKAIKYTFDVRTGSWSQEKVQVKLASDPFARGGLRKAFHLLDMALFASDPQTTYVAKMSIDPFEDREIYFQDAEMQMYARGIFQVVVTLELTLQFFRMGGEIQFLQSTKAC